MKKYLIAYGTFLVFVAVTNLVVRPAVQKAGVPLLKDAI